MNRNYSFNTIIAGLLLDQTDELPAPYLESWEDFHDAAKEQAFLAANYPHKPAVECVELLNKLQTTRPDDFSVLQRKSYLALTLFLQTKIPSTDRNITEAYGGSLYNLYMFDKWEEIVNAEFGPPDPSRNPSGCRKISKETCTDEK